MEPTHLSPDAKAFEAALRDHPDDLTGWCAYADYLAEHGDPRGEFMQVQIALEDESRPKAEREALKEREAALLKEYEREWLGELAPFVLDEGDMQYRTGAESIWERGFVSGLVVVNLSNGLAQALHDATATRFLHELHVHDTMRSLYGDVPAQPVARVPPPTGVHYHHELFELTGAPFLDNLRVFRVGNEEVEEGQPWCDCHLYTRGIEHVIQHMPRVEELHLLCKEYESASLFALPNLAHLRTLRMYHLGGRDYGRQYEYALDVLAANPAFANLTHLLLHPHCAELGDEDDRDLSYLPLAQVQALLRSPHLKKLTHLQLRLSDMGDDGVRAFIDSGILKRLRWLDLRHGCVTDEGARLLAACPDAKRLEHIDLSRNAVSAAGLAVLRKAGVNAVANQPLTQTELDEREYLREGDSE